MKLRRLDNDAIKKLGQQMSRTEIKQQAQDYLMQGVSNAFYALGDSDLPEDQQQLLFEEMDRQMARIERMFGYEPGSWTRGG